MRTNYNDSSRSGGRFPKRQNGGSKNGSNGGSGGSNNNGTRRPQGRRPGGHSGNGTVNAAGATAARNKYLELGKEALLNGNRVEAENFFQHAEHFSKLLNAAMESRREREESQAENNRRHNNHSNHSENTEVVAQEVAATEQVNVTPTNPEQQEPVAVQE